MTEEQTGTSDPVGAPSISEASTEGKKGSATRRVDSARDVVQESNDETEEWVDIGPASPG
jgi:hypothetical protein